MSESASSLFENASALDAEGRLQEAIMTYDKVIMADPHHAPAHNKRGVALARSGHIAEAIASIDKAIDLDPDYADAFYSSGVIQFMLGDAEAAIPMFDRAVDLDPDHAKAWHNRGIALFKTDQSEAALSSYDQALALTPDFAEAHKNRGLALKQLDRMEEALVAFANALDLDPAFDDALNARGVTLTDMERYEDALNDFNTGLAIKGNNIEMIANRGVVLTKLDRLDEARADLDLAVKHQPDNAVAHYNLGVTQARQLQFESALASYDRAIEINPHYAEAHNNRGAALNATMRLDEAMAAYDRAVAIDPDYAEAWWNKSLLLILQGHYAEGWAHYEWRLKSDDKNGHHPLDWRGESDINGQKIFIPYEQGFGDILQFCRYLPMLEASGAEIIFEVPKVLEPVISTLDCTMTTIRPNEPQPSFDAYCPLMSLPHVFKTSLDNIPAQAPYLKADAKKVEDWREKLGDRTLPRIGLAWSGNAKHLNDHNRSLALSRLQPILQDHVAWHSMQKEYRPDDEAMLHTLPQITRHETMLADFADTAGLIEAMDLVITVDTSIAHLAGALGKPVWILLPYVPDYRWGLDRMDCPWYPTARLFRQTRIGDWDSVINDLEQALSTSLLP